MQKPVLVVLAAGLGSRYQGLKQIDPMGKHGEKILDYSVYDAKRAGFETVIFVIKPEMEQEFEEAVGRRLRRHLEVRYAFQTLDKLPEGFASIPLPGHFFDMVGFRTPDDVVFLADCLSSREILDKYQIGFIYDVAGYLKTLEQVQTMTAKVFVPAHTEVTEDIADLAQYNIRKVHEIAERIVDLCAAPRGFEDILQQLFAAYGLTMSFEQYVLVGSTVRSYLAWLKDTGRLTALFEDGWMRWARV